MASAQPKYFLACIMCAQKDDPGSVRADPLAEFCLGRQLFFIQTSAVLVAALGYIDRKDCI